MRLRLDQAVFVEQIAVQSLDKVVKTLSKIA